MNTFTRSFWCGTAYKARWRRALGLTPNLIARRDHRQVIDWSPITLAKAKPERRDGLTGSPGLYLIRSITECNEAVEGSPELVRADKFCVTKLQIGHDM
jgi:hypothetical protein